jgi:hypothetical protein
LLKDYSLSREFEGQRLQVAGLIAAIDTFSAILGAEGVP